MRASFSLLEMFEKENDLTKMNKIQRRTCFPFIIHGIANHFAEVLMISILKGKPGEIMLQAYQKKFFDHIIHFREKYVHPKEIASTQEEFKDLVDYTIPIFPMIRHQDTIRLQLIQSAAKNKMRTHFDLWQDLYCAIPKIGLTKLENEPASWKDEIMVMN